MSDVNVIVLQRSAVVVLPDGAVKPAWEAWLPAQHPRLHHHGNSRSAGGGDQQPRAHDQEAGGSRYRHVLLSRLLDFRLQLCRL